MQVTVDELWDIIEGTGWVWGRRGVEEEDVNNDSQSSDLSNWMNFEMGLTGRR
jgi:hypothetical protein